MSRAARAGNSGRAARALVLVLVLAMAGSPMVPDVSLTAAAQDHEMENILVNPGFERAYFDGDIGGMRPVYWHIWPADLPRGVQMSQVDGVHHNGSHSAIIRSSVDTEVRWYQERQMEEDTELPFGGWVRTDLDEGSRVELRTRLLDRFWDTIHVFTTTIEEDVLGWAEFRSTLKVSGMAVFRVQLECVLIGPGEVWFDDMSVGLPTDMGNPPIIVSVPPLEACVGQEYSYRARAVDLEGDDITFSLERGPSGMSVGSTGEVLWTPAELPRDAVKVVLRATDEGNHSSFQDFFLGVTDEPVRRPVYAYVYSPYEDPFNDGLSNERYEVMLPILSELAEDHPDVMPSVTVLLMGPDVIDPGPGRSEALQNLSLAQGSDLIEIGYTGFHEPTYGNNPLYDPSYDGWTWSEKVTAFDRMLSRQRDPLTGEEEGFGKGGLQAVREVFDVVAVTGTGRDGAQLHALSRYDQRSMVVRLEGPGPWDPGPDPLTSGTLVSMLSEDPWAPAGSYWQDGRLVMGFPETGIDSIDAKRHPDELGSHFEYLDRRKVNVLPVLSFDTSTYVDHTAVVDGQSAWSPTGWAYSHHDEPRLPAEAVYAPEARREAYGNTCSTLRQLAEGYLPDASGRFVSSSDLSDLVDPSLGGPVPVSELAVAASDLLDRRDTLSYPNWVGVSWGFCRGDYQYFSLSEMYGLLLQALAHYDGTGSLPSSVDGSLRLLGPRGERAPSQPWQRVRLSAVVGEAVRQLGAVDDATWAVLPKATVPVTSSLEGDEINSMEFLLLMAEACIVLYEGRGGDAALLNIPSTRQWPVTQAVLELEGRGSHPGDSWGFKPATANLQQDTVPPVVRYVSPLDGAERVPLDTDISVTFSERMDETLSLDGAVVLDPPLAVDGAWVYHRLVVDPRGDMADNTTYRVTVKRTLEDAAGNPLATEVSWSFSTVGLGNGPPALLPWPEGRDVEVLENRSVRLGVIAEDDGPPPLSYSWRLDGVVVANATGDSFVFATSYTDEGDHTVTVVVSDGADPAGTSTFTWNVSVVNVNLPPRLLGASPEEGVVDLVEAASGRREFRVTAEDPDEGHLEFAWLLDGEQVPEDALSPDGSVFTYDFDFDSAGNHTLECQVRDRAGEGVDLEWTVRVADVNRPPLVLGIAPDPPPTVRVGQTVRVTVNATDPDGDVLAFEWTVDSVPVLTTPWPEWNFTAQREGSFAIEVWVTDGRGNPVQAFTAVNVLPEASPPPEPERTYWPWLLVVVVLAVILLVLAWPVLRRRHAI